MAHDKQNPTRLYPSLLVNVKTQQLYYVVNRTTDHNGDEVEPIMLVDEFDLHDGTNFVPSQEYDSLLEQFNKLTRKFQKLKRRHINVGTQLQFFKRDQE